MVRLAPPFVFILFRWNVTVRHAEVWPMVGHCPNNPEWPGWSRRIYAQGRKRFEGKSLIIAHVSFYLHHERIRLRVLQSSSHRRSLWAFDWWLLTFPENGPQWGLRRAWWPLFEMKPASPVFSESVSQLYRFSRTHTRCGSLSWPPPRTHTLYYVCRTVIHAIWLHCRRYLLIRQRKIYLRERCFHGPCTIRWF